MANFDPVEFLKNCDRWNTGVALGRDDSLALLFFNPARERAKQEDIDAMNEAINQPGAMEAMRAYMIGLRTPYDDDAIVRPKWKRAA